MRRPVYLLIIFLLGGAGAYYLGVASEAPVQRMIRRGSQNDAVEKLNARGIAELSAGNPEGAAAVLREASLLDPQNSVVRRNLSIALARQANQFSADEEAAVALLTESLRLWPKNPEGLDGLSTIHYRAGRYREALDPALVLQEMMPDRFDLAEYVDHIRGKIAVERGMSTEKGDNFRLLYSDQRRLEYEGEIVSILQTQLDSLTAALGIFPGRPIDVLLLTEELGSRASPADPFLEGLYDGQIRLYLGSGIEDREKLILTVRHEMVHALLHQAAGNLPGWVQEGLAQSEGEEPAREDLSRIGRYLAEEMRKGYRVDLATMGLTFINLDPESRARAYAASLLFMDYLKRSYGSGIIPRFIAELAAGTDPVASLRELTGMELASLEASFAADLERSF